MQKFSNRNYLKAFFLASIAGTLWSFGALIVRYMEAAQSYQWQYLFFRALTIAIVILIYLLVREGLAFINRFKKIGLAGLLGAVGLVTAMSGYILSITLTTVANTLFMLAAAPFIAAFLGIVFLKEKVRYSTWAAMMIALLGIAVMVMEGLGAGTFLGNLLALTIALAGVLCVLFALLVLFLHNETPAMPFRNVYLSMLHGFIVGFGLILFSISAKFLPAAELILLSLVEVVGGIVWVYLPILGIHEIPSLPTVVGGIIVLGAIVLDGVGVKQHMRIAPESPS